MGLQSRDLRDQLDGELDVVVSATTGTSGPAAERGKEHYPEGEAPRPETVEDVVQAAQKAGLTRVHMVAWRDLDDPEAGGSELHAHEIASEWAGAGLEVTVRTSAVAGRPAELERSGYRVQRRSGRYKVFPDAAVDGLRSGDWESTGLVEIWNGMPFFSPLWFKGPRIVFLHHVHAEMWKMVLPGWLARIGHAVEFSLAPRVYRSSKVITLSQSSRDEIVSMLGLPPSNIRVVPPGVEPRFSPGGTRSPTPLVVAVGRLVPVKRFDLLIEALAEARRECPGLRAVIIGEGYERGRLEAMRHRLGADEWLELPGRLEDDQLLEYYRSAWAIASVSLREGWGMTLTEAGACGTPAVATAIAGHRDAVVNLRSGLLADDEKDIADALVRILQDRTLNKRLSRGALEHARSFSWSATAAATLRALVDEAEASALSRVGATSPSRRRLREIPPPPT